MAGMSIAESRPRKLCANNCGRPRYLERRYCLDCDRQRRLHKYGLCVSCELRPVWASGLCEICYAREQREQQFARAFQGNPLNRDDFVHLVEGIITRLYTALLKAHEKYSRYVATGQGYDDPDIIQIQTLLFTARELRDNQYNYVVRQVNERLNGIYRLYEQIQEPA